MTNDLAIRACEALVRAYKDGAAGQHIEWSDIDNAYELAVAALKKESKKK